MKKVMLLLVMGTITQIFAFTVDGHAYLEGQTVYSGIVVNFQRTVPDTLFSTSTITDSLGYYSCSVEGGYYDVEYSKTGFINAVVEDAVLYSNQTLADQTLTEAGLEGSIKGILHRGEYNITGTLTVLEGDSLIIEPGTKLYFFEGTEFIVNGYLQSEGTHEDSIYFKAANDYLYGITLNSTSTGLIYNSSFSNSTIYIQSPNVILSNSVINTFGSGIVINSNCNLEFLRLNGNNSDSQGIHCSNSSVIIVSNCEITGFNWGMALWGCEASLYNVYLDGDFVGINNDDGSDLKIYNSTIINLDENYASGIDNLDGSVNISNSNVFGWGENYHGCGDYIGLNVTTNANGDPCDAYSNISMDPKFVDATNGNFRLQSDSPCIDAGTNTIAGYTFSITDLGSCVRIWDGDGNGSEIVDMGAYEYGSPVGIENNITAVSSFELNQNYPNPFNPVTTINYALPQASQVELNVYNLNGQLVQSLVNGRLDNGIHKAEFNGADLTSGMYIYNLKVDGKSVQSKKMMLLK